MTILKKTPRLLNAYYFSITFPSGYKCGGIKTLIFLMLSFIISLLLMSNIVYLASNFAYFNQLLNIVLMFSMFQLFFIKFNLFIRIFLLIFKGIPFFISKLNSAYKSSNLEEIKFLPTGPKMYFTCIYY